jgi:hypothetical protein
MKFFRLASTFEGWMFASGCGNACVADHGILLWSQLRSIFPDNNVRKHEMQRNAKLLSAMEVSKAGRVRNDRIRNKLFPRPLQHRLLRVRVSPISSLKARSPAALHDLEYFSPTLANDSVFDGFHARHQAWVVDHEGHEGSWIATYAKELQPILLDELLKDWMCREAHAVVVGFFEDTAKRNKRLDVSSRTDNMHYQIERRWFESVLIGGRGLRNIFVWDWRKLFLPSYLAKMFLIFWRM